MAGALDKCRQFAKDAGAAITVPIIIGLIIASLSAAGIITMPLAIGLLFLAWLAGIGLTFVTGPRWWPSHKHRWIFAFVLALLLCCIGWYEVEHYESPPTEKGIVAGVVSGLSRDSTQLAPSDIPTPKWVQAKCLVPKDALIVLWGSNVSWSTERMPHTIIQMGPDRMLTIDRAKDGKSLVVTTLRIFDDRNNIIARIDEDGFWVENSSRKKRPDASTLVVYDHNDTEVLNVKFLRACQEFCV